jgi:RsiW-degrading membrane proteinase PrsW (M82 family)
MTPIEARPELQSAAGTINEVVEDLKNINFRQEIVPVDSEILASMRRDFVFWSAAVLAVVPLGLMTLEGRETQITGFCLFAAAMWGVIFARFIVNANTDWRWLVGSLFFTGLVGIPVLLTIYNFLPSFYNALPASENVIMAMLGSILHTGVTEELCKIASVLIYLAMRRQAAKPLDLVLIGVFSGLGFAAFENVIYVGRSVDNAFARAGEDGVGGLVTGVQEAMINVLLRSLSCVCAHGVWSGVFSYFIAMAVATRKRFAALFLVGLATAAVLHGTYNGMMRIQNTVPAIVVFGSFVLFYAYLTRLRLTVGSEAATATS